MNHSQTMKRVFTFASAVFFALAPLIFSEQLSPELSERLQKADREITRLAPVQFPNLPRHLIRELQDRGCTIPQESHVKTQENVIRGEFASRGQIDWAILCSVNRVSAILVFWNGSEKNPSELAKRSDANFIQDIGNGEIGFSRIITAAGRKWILQHYDAYSGPKPPPINHQGIDDGFAGKGSVVHYLFRGKWMELSGAD